MKKIFLAALFFIFSSHGAFGEEKNKSKSDPSSGRYLVLGLTHTEGTIDHFRYLGKGISVGIEEQFEQPHLFVLSGWSITYRKEDLQSADAGHYLDAVLHRDFLPRHPFSFRVGGGMEYGFPKLTFDKTRFYYRDGVLVSYDHIFLVQNQDINLKEYGITKHGILYPFGEASLVLRKGRLFFEAGMRGTLMRFGDDSYDAQDSSVTLRNAKRVVPTAFVKFGIRMGGTTVLPFYMLQSL